MTMRIGRQDGGGVGGKEICVVFRVGDLADGNGKYVGGDGSGRQSGGYGESGE